jgi:hypothetical protein
MKTIHPEPAPAGSVLTNPRRARHFVAELLRRLIGRREVSIIILPRECFTLCSIEPPSLAISPGPPLDLTPLDLTPASFADLSISNE